VRIALIAFLMPFVRPVLTYALKLVTDFMFWVLSPFPRLREVLYREV